MKQLSCYFSLGLLMCLGFVSCDKGYEVRFTNYNLERIDTLVVGKTGLVFLNTDKQGTTDFKPVTRGNHYLKFVSKSGKRYSAFMYIPGKGTGKRTIQIDAINQISVLEE